MTPIHFFDDQQGRRLGQAMKALRRHNGRTSAEVAAALGMPLRSFQHLESGVAKPDLEKVAAFARIMDADPFALLLAAQMGSTRFAIRASSNKAALAVVIALEQFDRDAGDRILQLDTARLLAAMSEAFGQLAKDLEARDVLGVRSGSGLS